MKKGQPPKTARTNVDDAVKNIKNGSKPIEKREFLGEFSSGSDLIDLVIGGSYPYGFANIVGDSSSGKSFLAGEIIASAYHKYGTKRLDWFYDNAEGGYKFNSKKLYDFDILEEGFFSQNKKSHTIEDFQRNIEEIINTKKPSKKFVYILDSYDSITSDEEVKFKEKKLKKKKPGAEDDTDSDKKEKGSYNLAKQKEGHAFFRTYIRKLEDNRISLVVVSQVKEKIGVTFGRKLYRTGGKALDFYPNIILWLAEVHKYGKPGRSYGICTKVQATKTRNDRPFRTCLVDLIFDYGIDNICANINFLYDLKTVGKNQDKEKLICNWEGKEYNREQLIKHIDQNELSDVLAERTIKKWNDIEDALSSDWRKPRWKK